MVSLLALMMAALPSCANTPQEAPVKDYSVDEGLSIATFAGGCFWCMQAPYDVLDGVVEVIAGYTGGDVENPSYQQVSSGDTGHYEAIQISYDPEKVSYEQLLEVFWRQIDPTDAGGQFADRGPQYRTAIFYHDETQKELAEKSRLQLETSGKFDKPIATLILPAKAFYMAEEYHQDYYEKNSRSYDAYKRGSGREGFLEENWPER
jgi:peptide methionine sulfoxide reductase msrA/msrB